VTKVLVTGASGMLGGAVARSLIERGDDVTVLQRHAAGLDCQEVLGDVADPTVVRRAARGHEAVVHLAAKVDVSGPWSEYVRANVEGTRNVVDACRAEGVGRLVHVSSPSVAHAGQPLVGVGAEPADPAHARGSYARSKAMAEQEALAADCGALAVLVVRPHLVWGPGDTQLVERIVERARRGRLFVLGSGAALIDTTYVTNAVDALVAALDACGRVHGEPLVVSNGEPRPVGEILARLCRAAAVPAPTRHLPFLAGWVAGAVVEQAWTLSSRRDTPPLTRFLAEQLATAHWFDQRRTRDALGWAPRVTLEEGFEELWAWYAASTTPPTGAASASRVTPSAAG
jgi:2-alkyl-3-oxoalkanoate reductase